MTRKDIAKDFFFKTVVPVLIAGLLFAIFKKVFTNDGVTDYFLIWLMCGIPFGIRRMYLWIIPRGFSLGLGGMVGVWALNFIVGGLIGGFILAWRLLVAAWYIILTIYRLATFNSTSNRMAREVVQSAVMGVGEDV